MSKRGQDQGGLRNWMNENPLLVAIPLVLVVLAALWYGLSGLFSSSAEMPSQYYTVDDGKTHFIHDYEMPPFTYNGQEAYQAMVYTCDGGATKFVAYLLRLTDKGREGIAAAMKHPEGIRSVGRTPAGWIEVKRPGEDEWVADTSIAATGGAGITGRAEAAGAVKAGDSYAEITQVKCPDGKNQAVQVGTAKPEE